MPFPAMPNPAADREHEAARRHPERPPAQTRFPTCNRGIKYKAQTKTGGSDAKHAFVYDDRRRNYS